MAARVAIVVAVALAALLVWLSIFSVDQTQSALVTRFGLIEEGEQGPGLHFKSPLEQVHRFDRRIMTHTYAGESFLTSDQKQLDVDFYLKWRLIDVRRYYQSATGDEDMVAPRLADLVRDRIKTAVAREPLAAVAATARGGLGTDGFEQMRAAARELGVDLIDLQLQRIDLTDDAANAVYKRMEQSFTDQAQQLGSSGALQADKIHADADDKRADTLANATREAQRIRGDADARAAAVYAQAYGRNPEFAAFTQSLQAYKSAIGREGDILVITPEGSFFKYLQNASGQQSASGQPSVGEKSSVSGKKSAGEH